MVASQLRAPVTKLMEPVYSLLAKLGIHPNMITIVGLGVGIVGGWAFATGTYLVAGICIALSGFLDLLDGGVARVGGYASDEGAFLDSVADRIGESAIYVGVVIGFSDRLLQLLGLGLLVISYSISYLRARGEGLGVTLAGIGIMERAERMTAMMIAAFIAYFTNPAVLVWALGIIFSLTVITAIHRFVKVYGALKLSATSN